MALLFEENFESIAAIEANGAAGYHNLVTGDIVPGFSGNAISITGSRYLKYPTPGRFNFGKGCMRMRVKVNWDPNITSSSYRYLFRSGWGTTQFFDLWLYDGGNHISAVRPYLDGNPHLWYGLPAYGGIPSGPGDWHQFDFYWDLTLGTSSYTMCKWNDKYSSFSWWNGGTIEDLEDGKLINIGANLDGCIDSISIYNDPSDLLPVDISLFPTSNFIYTTIRNQANAGDTLIDVGSTVNFVVNTPIWFILDNGVWHRTSVKAITDVDIVEINNPISAGRTVPVGNNKVWTKLYNPWSGTDANIRAFFPDGDGICSAWETHATNPLDCPLLDAEIDPDDDVLFFKKPHLEQVFEGCVPTEAEIDANFTWKGNPGEKHTLFFNVYSRIALTNVAVNFTQFSGSSGTIATSNIDLRIVKNWWQGSDDGGYAFETFPTWVGELMLHDDVSYKPEEDQTMTINSHIIYPTLPIPDPISVTTAIPAAISRQLAMIVTIPAGTASGDYTCTVTLMADGGVEVSKVITLTVLPFALIDHNMRRSVWLWPEADRPLPQTMGLDIWDIFEKQLADIRSIGYDTLNLACYNTGTTEIVDSLTGWNITDAIQKIKDAGFKELHIYGVAAGSIANLATRYDSALVTLMINAGFEPYLVAEDEFDHQTLNPCTGLVNQTIEIDATAHKLKRSSGSWTTDGVRNQAGVKIILRGCTNSANDGIYTLSYAGATELIWKATTATPVSEVGNGNQVVLSLNWAYQVKKAKHINAIGGKVYTSSESKPYLDIYMTPEILAVLNAADYPEPDDPAGDATIHAVDFNIGARGLLTVPPVTPYSEQVREGYYWQIRDGLIRWHRYNAGYQQYLTGLRSGPSSYNTDYSQCNEFNFSSTGRTYGISFNSVSGAGATDYKVIPCFNAQAHREGIRDAKYLATWQWWYDRIKTSHPGSAADSKAEVDAIKARYTDDGIGSKPCDYNSYADFDADREAIINEILRLKNLLLCSRGFFCGVIPEKVGGRHPRRVAGVAQ